VVQKKELEKKDKESDDDSDDSDKERDKDGYEKKFVNNTENPRVKTAVAYLR
jgi:hypothetical protein